VAGVVPTINHQPPTINHPHPSINMKAATLNATPHYSPHVASPTHYYSPLLTCGIVKSGE
jgi:hypothetical protein